MYTQPAGLAESVLADALLTGWHFRATSLNYQPVGFGSHHWLAVDGARDQLFVTVDDLLTKQHGGGESTNSAASRLERAFGTARSLQQDAGLEFVVAPIPAADGRLLWRPADRYSMVVHPYLTEAVSRPSGEFETGADRLIVLKQIVALHGADAVAPLADSLEVPVLGELTAAMATTGQPWPGGPYGSRARDLLDAHATQIAEMITAYETLVARAAGRPGRRVITHGEPHARNVLKTPAGFVFVDWDTTLLAQPERDLWELALVDPSIPAAYTAATGVTVDPDMLALYRMWFDLDEISGYFAIFHHEHHETEDVAASWKYLQQTLRLAERWPDGFLPG